MLCLKSNNIIAFFIELCEMVMEELEKKIKESLSANDKKKKIIKKKKTPILITENKD